MAGRGVAKIPKGSALYFPARYISRSGVGSKCLNCRDFIKLSSLCVLVSPSKVSAQHGTCGLFVLGDAPPLAEPRNFISQSMAGYIEGPEVPTYCGRCEYYLTKGGRNSLCAKVGDTDEDTVEYGGCCDLYSTNGQ